MTKNVTRRGVCAGLAAGAALLPMGARAHPFELPDRFRPQLVNTGRPEWLPGEVHVMPDEYFLYFMLERGRAIRYGVGVGRDNLYESGTFTVERKEEWPRWRPTDAMIRRDPGAYARFADGVPGGPNNPLGARALYLYDETGRDTYLRIHGTNAPETIGTSVSNGCARLTNEYVIDLYPRVSLGARTVLHPKAGIGVVQHP